jgi:hypothetical protein
MKDDTHDLRMVLPDLADRTHGQLLELFNATTAERAFLAAQQLHQVYSVLMRLGAALEREGRQEAA